MKVRLEVVMDRLGMRAGALVVLAAWLGVGCSAEPKVADDAGGGRCTRIGCESGLTLTVPLPVPLEALPTLQAEVCKSGECLRGSLARLTQVTAPGTVTESIFPESPAAGPHARVLLMRGADASLSLQITYVAVQSGDLRDGDIIRFALTDGTTTPYSFERAVDFEDVRPNGPTCEPKCRQAQIDLTKVDGGAL